VQVEVRILVTAVGEQRKIIRTVLWLSFLRNFTGGSSLYTCGGIMRILIHIQVCMSFLTSLVFCSCIFLESHHLIPSSIPGCTQWVGIFSWSFYVRLAKIMAQSSIFIHWYLLMIGKWYIRMVGIIFAMGCNLANWKVSCTTILQLYWFVCHWYCQPFWLWSTQCIYSHWNVLACRLSHCRFDRWAAGTGSEVFKWSTD